MLLCTFRPVFENEYQASQCALPPHALDSSAGSGWTLNYFPLGQSGPRYLSTTGSIVFDPEITGGGRVAGTFNCSAYSTVTGQTIEITDGAFDMAISY